MGMGGRGDVLMGLWGGAGGHQSDDPRAPHQGLRQGTGWCWTGGVASGSGGGRRWRGQIVDLCGLGIGGYGGGWAIPPMSFCIGISNGGGRCGGKGNGCGCRQTSAAFGTDRRLAGGAGAWRRQQWAARVLPTAAAATATEDRNQYL